MAFAAASFASSVRISPSTRERTEDGDASTRERTEDGDASRRIGGSEACRRTTVGSTLARRHLATRSNVAHEVVFFRVRSEVLERVRVAEVQRPAAGEPSVGGSVVAFGDVLDDAVEHLGRARVVVVPQAPDVVRALEQSGVETAREHLAKRGDTGAAADHATVRIAPSGSPRLGLVRGNRLVAASQARRLEPRRGAPCVLTSHDREREHEREGDEKGGEGGRWMPRPAEPASRASKRAPRPGRPGRRRRPRRPRRHRSWLARASMRRLRALGDAASTRVDAREALVPSENAVKGGACLSRRGSAVTIATSTRPVRGNDPSARSARRKERRRRPTARRSAFGTTDEDGLSRLQLGGGDDAQTRRKTTPRRIRLHHRSTRGETSRRVSRHACLRGARAAARLGVVFLVYVSSLTRRLLSRPRRPPPP